MTLQIVFVRALVFWLKVNKNHFFDASPKAAKHKQIPIQKIPISRLFWKESSGRVSDEMGVTNTNSNTNTNTNTNTVSVFPDYFGRKVVGGWVTRVGWGLTGTSGVGVGAFSALPPQYNISLNHNDLGLCNPYKYNVVWWIVRKWQGSEG